MAEPSASVSPGKTGALGTRGGFAPKELGKSLLASGLPYTLLRMRALKGNPITILCYHTLRPDDDPIDAWTAVREADFVRQMEYLRAHYDIVSLDAAIAGAAAKSSKPRVVVTFDDGEAGLYDSLLPIVSALSIPVTLYIATAQIETGQPYWFDAIMNALQADGPFDIDLSAEGLKVWNVGAERGASRWAVISDILETLKTVSPEKRTVLASSVIAQAPQRAGISFKPLQPLSIERLAELAESEWVTIGAHSHCHNLLDQIPAEDARTSIDRSRMLLEDWTGQTVLHFAYPNGNYNAAVEATVAQLGFRSAMALEGRLWHRGGSLFVLPRVLIGRYDDFDRFKLRLAEV